MKKLTYILVFSVFTLVVAAQNKKGNTGAGGNTKPSTTSEKENLSDKELTNYLLNKFSSSGRVEFDDINSANGDPDAVTSLKLRRQGLADIPDLSKFKNLVELDLSDNEIVDFSSKLSGLPNLQVLNLSGNKLTSIPADLCNLKNLRTLNLSSNKIASGSLSCLSSLERLYLNNNQLTSLPAGITEIQSLKSLYLHSNKLTSLDEKLAKLVNLEVLFVQFNKIAEEPNTFKQTGIINYIFAPQILNNKYLYAYMAKGSSTYVKTNNNDDGSVSNNGTLNADIFLPNEKIENSAYNIRSVDVGNGYRRIKVNEYEYRQYSKFRMYVLSSGLLGSLHWVLSKNHRNNYRLTKINLIQQTVDKVIAKKPNAIRRFRVNTCNRVIVRVYKRYLRSNSLTSN